MSDISLTSEELSDETADSSTVLNDIDEIIQRCQNITLQVNNSDKALNNVKSLMQIINVSYRGAEGDFSELLDVLHDNAISNIKNGAPSNFTENLLEILEDANLRFI
jgi:hypothetical protein